MAVIDAASASGQAGNRALVVGADVFVGDLVQGGLYRVRLQIDADRSGDYDVVNETDPRNPDTDGDGMPNRWEIRKELNPSDATNGATDPDGDGYTNLEDYLNWLAQGNTLW